MDLRRVVDDLTDGFTAWMGIFANLLGLGYYVTLSVAPHSVIPLSAATPFLLIWYLWLGRGLSVGLSRQK